MTRRAAPMAVTLHRQQRPHYESRPYRPHPGRREHIYGRIQPADEIVSFGRRIPSTRIGIAFALFALAIFAGQLIRGLL